MDPRSDGPEPEPEKLIAVEGVDGKEYYVKVSDDHAGKGSSEPEVEGKPIN
jgi:hypothetical protein